MSKCKTMAVKYDFPYLTSDIPGVPGEIKERYEDFQVDEIPAYQPSGQGDHTYFYIEKRGLATRRAIQDIARALGVKPGRFGVAGKKDARGVTRQMISLEHADPERILSLEIPRIKILDVSRHRNKLRMGHLLGNRFVIKLRNTDPQRVDDVRAVLKELSQKGVPNYFGPQRFGNRGDTWQVGKALLLNDFVTAAELVAGRPGPDDEGDVLEARKLFHQGHYTQAQAAWPRGFSECQAVCRGMKRFDGDHQRAIMSLDKRALGFYVSACQSWLFNNILAARIHRLGEIEEGDLAWKQDNGAVFMVEDAAAEAPRAERFEISPTGPLFGPKMKLPGGNVAEMEKEALENEGLCHGSFVGSGPLKSPGGRRALRFKPEGEKTQLLEDEHGKYIEIRFMLAPGCYATAILGEICKEYLVSS